MNKTQPAPARVAALCWLCSVLPGYPLLDQDGNGLSDLWQQMHPGLVANEDSDGDGFSNRVEAAAGTDPLSNADIPRVSAIQLVNGGTAVRLGWNGVSGKRYQAEQWNVESGAWEDRGGKVAAGGADTLEIPVAATDGKGIFRLKIVDDDPDGDGLSTWEERLLGLNEAAAATGAMTDYEQAMRMLEGQGTLALQDGTNVSKRAPHRNEVVRFLAQASFGADPDLVDHVMSVGIGGWLDEQLAPAAPTSTYSIMFGNAPLNASTFPSYWAMGWWRAAMEGPDQLRLRMGNALSQIFVISTAGSDLIRHNSYTQADYYDILLTHSLGNYRNLIDDVTWSTQMGLYLSHLQNRKSDVSIGRYPDENFAREIMQLFSIGLWKLNPDGTRMHDSNGRDIPTYDNGTITEMAKVFTGFGYGGPAATSFFTGVNGLDFVYPMKMWDGEHEPGEKHLFDSVVIPAGQTGTKDVADTLDALCAHPNVGPFFSRLLIQRFTSSNPSPDYIRRVASRWADNGGGVRGDLKAVLRAILTDPEARIPASRGDASGKVREPYLRLVAMMRAFKARNALTPPTYPVWTGSFSQEIGQQPLASPSVFNFYLPDHRPAGELRNRGLAAPELEIATADRMIQMENKLIGVLNSGLMSFYNGDAATWVKCNFTTELAMAENAANIPALVDHLDELLTWGAMSSNTRLAVITAVNAEGSPSLTPAQNAVSRVTTAVRLIVESPDFVVLK